MFFSARTSMPKVLCLAVICMALVAALPTPEDVVPESVQSSEFETASISTTAMCSHIQLKKEIKKLAKPAQVACSNLLHTAGSHTDATDFCSCFGSVSRVAALRSLRCKLLPTDTVTVFAKWAACGASSTLTSHNGCAQGTAENKYLINEFYQKALTTAKCQDKCAESGACTHFNLTPDRCQTFNSCHQGGSEQHAGKVYALNKWFKPVLTTSNGCVQGTAENRYIIKEFYQQAKTVPECTAKCAMDPTCGFANVAHDRCQTFNSCHHGGGEQHSGKVYAIAGNAKFSLTSHNGCAQGTAENKYLINEFYQKALSETECQDKCALDMNCHFANLAHDRCQTFNSCHQGGSEQHSGKVYEKA